MAVKIKPLRKFTTGSPSTSNMEEGEIAVNTADKKVFMRDDSNNIVEVGASSELFTGGATTNIDINGRVTADEFRFKDSNTLLVSTVYDGSSGGSYFSSNEIQEILSITPSGASENYIILGTITLSSGSSASAQTLNIHVSLRSNTLPDLAFKQSYNEELTVADDTYITPILFTKETTTASMKLCFKASKTIFGVVSANLVIIARTDSDLGNVSVNTTTASEFTGTPTGFTERAFTRTFQINAGNYGFGNAVNIEDSTSGGILNIGDGADLRLYHNGSNSVIANDVGSLYIVNETADADITLQADDGTGSANTPYITLDGSEGEVDLNHYGNTKLTTKSTGVDITGTISSNATINKYGSTSAPIVFSVTVATQTAAHPYNGDGSTSKYVIDGIMGAAPTLHGADETTSNSEYIYRFDQADSTNANHPLRFYEDAAKTQTYTTGVTTNGTPGQAGAYTQIAVTRDTPRTLYYQCNQHDYMGNYVTIVNSGRYSSVFPSGTTTRSLPTPGAMSIAEPVEEDTHVFHPYFNNDLGHFIERGGSYAWGGVSSVPSEANTKKLFNANGDFLSLYNSNFTGTEVTLTLTNLPKSLQFSAYTGIVFGQKSMAPDGIKIETSTNNGNSWSTRLTDASRKSHYVTTFDTGGTATNAIRFTFEKNTGSYSYSRIRNITAYNYNSAGMENYFLPLSGGTVYGSINLGHASDTTLARSSAGVVQIEGNTILTVGNSDAPTTTTSSGDADFVLIDDGGTMKKITPANLGVGSGGASDSFKTIAVSGQSDVVADSSTDTLTLVAGNNMTIQTNASGDEISFAASGGAGSGISEELAIAYAIVYG